MSKGKFDKRAKLSFLLLVVFLFSVLSVNWKNSIHTGGFNVLREILFSAFTPELSTEVLKNALLSAWQTLVYALISISIAIIIGFALGILASGVLIKNNFVKSMARSILAIFRAIHELVWAWLFVAAIGLNPIGAIFALAIPYSGALGKVYADLLIESKNSSTELISLNGGSNLTKLIYGYLPSTYKELIGYTIYRLECAIRSSSVLSFVGLGGIGFQIQVSLNDLNYNRVWTFIYTLVILVIIVDIWGNIFRRNIDVENSRINKISYFSLSALFISSWIYIIKFDDAVLHELFSSKNIEYFGNFIKGLIGIGENPPAYLDPELWKQTGILAIETINMSILAIGITFILVMLTVVPASINIKNKSLLKNNSIFTKISYFIIRLMYIISRSVPELMWAMIFVFIFKPGIVPGALALAIHNFGVLGKLCIDTVEEMDEKPIKNLFLNGATNFQILIYGIIPQIMTKILNYTLYRWEIIIRSTIVVGFVGSGGIGMAFKLAMSFFKYSEITLYMLAYIIIVLITEFISQITKNYIRD